MFQPEYLVIALSTLGLLLRTKASHFQGAYNESREQELALRDAVAELQTLRATEAQARRDAEEAARIKSDFLAHVSHEVRTPLNAVSGAALLLQDSQLTPEQRECIEVLKAGSDSLLAILDDILDYSKIEAGKMELDPRPMHLRDCVRESLRLLQPQAEARGLRLSAHVGAAVPAVITGDAARLRQVLLNLLSNALKFTDAGSVTLYVTPIARGAGDADLLRFAVRDTGIGIPYEEQARLFQPFTQVERHTMRHDSIARRDSGARRHGGAGLGLAISRQLVTLMGGQIWLESHPHRGSTFFFTLPIASHPPKTL